MQAVKAAKLAISDPLVKAVIYVSLRTFIVSYYLHISCFMFVYCNDISDYVKL